MIITSLLLVSSTETIRTLQASSSALNWLKYKTKGHKHVTVSSKNSLDARPHEGTLAHSMKRTGTNLSLITTMYTSNRAEKLTCLCFSWWKAIRTALKGNANCTSPLRGSTHAGKPKGCHSLYISIAQKIIFCNIYFVGTPWHWVMCDRRLCAS